MRYSVIKKPPLKIVTLYSCLCANYTGKNVKRLLRAHNEIWKIPEESGSVYNIKTSIHWMRLSNSGIQNIAEFFLEFLSNMLNTKQICKIYSRIDIHYRFKILSTFEFSDPNDLLPLPSVFTNNHWTHLDVFHMYNTKTYTAECGYFLIQKGSSIFNNNNMTSQNLNSLSDDFLEHSGFPPVVTFLSQFYQKDIICGS